MVNQGDYTLSKQEIEEGIKHCNDKAKSFINDCEFLFQNKRNMNMVLGLYTFALEEYGKGLKLNDHLLKPKKTYNIQIFLFGKGGGVKSHKEKINRALKELPPDCKHFYPAELIKSNTDTNTKTISVGPNGKSVSVIGMTTGIFEDTTSGNDVIYIEGNPESDFDTGFTADFLARMNCLYVDWNNNNRRWKYGVSVSEENMSYLISELKKKIFGLS
jgi:hypothetical protein